MVNAKGEEVILNDGELICDQCNGSGVGEIDKNSNYIITPFCQKCRGKGKVDWISNATGEQDSGYLSISMDDSDFFSSTIAAEDIMINGKSLIETISQKVAEEVDKKIMEIFGSTLEQKIKNRE